MGQKLRRAFSLLALIALFVAHAALALSNQEEPDKQVPAPSAGDSAKDETKPKEPTDFTKLEGYSKKGGAGQRVVEIPIEETIDLGLASFVERVLEGLKPTDILLLRIKTFGGRVDAAVRIRDQLLAAKVPTIAFVDQRAISAGALITLSADTILMSKGASLGAATPVQQEDGKTTATSEKVVSYMRAEMRATAEAKGRPPDVAEAMVDADLEVKGVVEKGKLLTLTSSKAVELGIADAQVDGIEDALIKLNLKQAAREPATVNWGEDLARILTDPVLSSLLMSFGFIGLLMELYSPGFGIGGTIGVVCLLLFFGGHYAAQLAGWEEALLILVGVGLVTVEVFVIPGTTVVGLFGILFLCTGLVMAMIRIDIPLGVAFDLGYLGEAVMRALARLSIAIVSLVVAAVLAARYLPGSKVGSWLVFNVQRAGNASASLGAEAHGGSLPASLDDLVGKLGTAQTVLRPTGVADFAGRRVDVLTEGEFVDAGRSVQVLRVDGHRVVVRSLPAKDPADERLHAS